MVQKRRHYRGGYQRAGLANAARELRKGQTRAEEFLWHFLRDRQLLGFKFRRQHQFGDYITDFYCREASLVIECDGDIHESNEQWQHDRVRDTYMVTSGLRVLRFTNAQILNETEDVLKEVISFLPSHHSDKSLSD